MKKLLIPFLWFGILHFAAAQIPEMVTVSSPVKPDLSAQNRTALPCNFAGTFTLGAFSGQSNDTDLDTIFLCFGDSIFIDHNGDFDLSTDPDPSTQNGIAWAFYNCPPVIAGDNLQAILGDPCLTTNPAPPTNVGMWLARGTIDGDIMFRNTGNLQSFFNMGDPLILHFAPITVDNWDSLRYENQPGFPSGPCVNVNTAVQFAVAYLNPITGTDIDSAYLGNDCMGSFRIRGGLPELLSSRRYSIDISLASDPNVKALIHLPPATWNHDVVVQFSVSRPGLYTVTIEDGKSCGTQFQVNMGACNPNDEVTIVLPDTLAPPGSTLCYPVTVENFTDLISATFNLGWNPAILQYVGVQNPNPNLIGFDANGLNEINAPFGQLGVNIFDQTGLPFSVPDGEALFEVCFNVIGMLDSCTTIFTPSSPAVTSIEDQFGIPTALVIDSGLVCVNYLPLNMSINLVDTMCGASSQYATLAVTPTGGIPPYEVTWQLQPGGAVNNGTIANFGDTLYSPDTLISGTWVITIRDQNGAGDTYSDTLVLDFATLGASLNFTQQPTCFGSCDGIVCANVLFNGSVVPNPDPFEYQLNWSGSGVIQGLLCQDSSCAGNYAVTVTQVSTGCTAIASGTLSQPLRLQDDNMMTTITDATCTGLSDGSIVYAAQGGTPFPGGIYDFNWTYTPLDGSGGPFQDEAGLFNPHFLVNKPAGFYSVTITDANGCRFIDSTVLLDAQRVVDLTIDAFNTSCSYTTDGRAELTVTVTPSDPSDNFSFFIAPFGGTLSCLPLSCTVTDLPPGMYDVIAIDAQGCADTASFTIASPPPLVLDTLSITRPSCVFPNNGSITVIAVGGTGNLMTYQYTWDDASTGPDRMNLAPGMYGVTVNDINGCEDSLAFDLQLPDPPTITSIDSVSVQCSSDGCLSVTATDTTMLIYSWQTVFGQLIDTTQQVCGLPGGDYVVVVTNELGCEATDTVTLGAVDTMFFADTTFLLPSCFGYSDGRIGVTVSGGAPNYTYLWDDPVGQSAPTLFDVPSGTYTLTVTDTNNCTLTGEFTLEDPPSIQTTYQQTPATCADTCNGQAIPTVLYSDGAMGDFDFAWCDGSTDSTRLDLCPGACEVTIVDGNNCFVIDTVFTDSPDSVSTSALSSTPTTCFGDMDGAVSVTGAGGNGGPFSYLWSVNNAMTPTVTGLPTGDYTVTVTDVAGCTGEFTIFVDEPAELIVTQDILNSFPPKCFGGDDGQLGVTATGGNPGPYVYAWADSSGNALGAGPILENIPSGEYFITVTDVKGCTGALQNLVLDDPLPIVGSILPLEDLLCNGDETTLFIDTVYGGSGAPFQYSLDFGVRLDPTIPITIDGGTHFITYYDRLNCEITEEFTVFEPDPITVEFDPPVIEIKLGDTLTTLQPDITGALIDTFFWVPGYLLSDSTVLNPMIQTFTSTTYTLTVFDANGCSGTGSIEVEVDPDRNIFIPNVFHPGNTSGLNDRFNVYAGLGVQIVNYFQIFDRWGGLMYERTDFLPSGFDFSEGWDGRYKGDFVDAGVYVYVAEVRFLDGRVLTYRGDVTVVR